MFATVDNSNSNAQACLFLFSSLMGDGKTMTASLSFLRGISGASVVWHVSRGASETEQKGGCRGDPGLHRGSEGWMDGHRGSLQNSRQRYQSQVSQGLSLKYIGVSLTQTTLLNK